jgi:hypothetical protein
MSDLTIPTSAGRLNHPQRRASGWLLFFIFTLVFIGPATRIFGFLGAYRHSMELFSRSSHPHLFFAYYASEQLASFAVRGYGLFAGIRLWRISPGAVGQAKRFLFYLVVFSVADYATGAMYVVLTTPEATSVSALSKFLTGQAAKAILQACIYAGVWYSYLLKSDRVRVTFSRDQPTAVSSS